MNILFWKKQSFLEKKNLENKIIRFINKAEEHLPKNFDLGKRFLIQANNLYNELGYTFKVETNINQSFLKYMNYKLW